ncbi:MAG: 16S rRNA (guanine(966)-N(2))-methyltransferase RsmD [Deltaproteobacteria bacterium RIFCSPLOWO2_02_FULL_53_8]|nr:MAG: 16S rRNA (guanine(966)-N(2))-methyltransferase RsmD [Deltaproteobacteria bacterium RIFCSPLOWO2_02_FULL_53_8]
MRVVGGRFKGRRLCEFAGRSIRPTSDKVRQALFNILYHPDEGFGFRRALDLFAGTGAMGIEAVSRGAQEAVFVDIDPSALSVVRKNLESCGLGNSQVLLSGAREAINRLSMRHEQFDLIFIDPPYASTLANETLMAIDASKSILSEDGLCVVETVRRTPITIEPNGLQLIDERRYGDTLIYIYKKESSQ